MQCYNIGAEGDSLPLSLELISGRTLSLAFFRELGRLQLYEVNPDYISYLMKYEPNKILSSANGKDKRKYLGIIVMKERYKYLVPLSSPKYRKDYEIKGYSKPELPIDFSFEKYEDRIVLLKDTCTPVVYMYKKTCKWRNRFIW